MSYEPTELASKMVEYMDCHCDVFAPTEDDDLIIKAYRSELQRGKSEGFTPVLVSVDETLWGVSRDERRRGKRARLRHGKRAQLP